MDKTQPIGVIDSGVGGLSVLKWLSKKMPREHFIFLGDTARIPYGDRPREELIGFVRELTSYLDRRNIKQLVVACNTITTLGVDVIGRGYDFDVIGMVKGSPELQRISRKHRVGFFATDFTVAAGSYKKEIERLNPDVKAFGLGCPKLVPLIEGEKFDTPEMEAAINEYATIMKSWDVDTVLLSCTHYPFLKEEIQKALGPAITVIDPAAMTTERAYRNLAERGLLNDSGEGSLEICFTRDVERCKRLASRMLDVNECVFHEVTLEASQG
jgi:glutamate racemase